MTSQRKLPYLPLDDRCQTNHTHITAYLAIKNNKTRLLDGETPGCLPGSGTVTRLVSRRKDGSVRPIYPHRGLSPVWTVKLRAKALNRFGHREGGGEKRYQKRNKKAIDSGRTRAMNSWVLPPVALGPVTARRSVLNLPRDRRAMSRNFCKPLPTLLKHRQPRLIAPRRLLSSSSSSSLHHRVDKMSAKENAWVGYQGAAGFDLRSEFATILHYLYRKGTRILTIRPRRHPDDANSIYAGGHRRDYAHG